MRGTDHYDVLVIGSGEAGKYLAWTLSKEGRRTALIERKMVGRSCPNVACLDALARLQTKYPTLYVVMLLPPIRHPIPNTSNGTSLLRTIRHDRGGR